MPKSQSPKLTRALCDVPIETINASSLLPRQADRNWLVLFQLGSEIEEERLNLYFEPVHPKFIVLMLEYLKEKNELERDITIAPNNIQESVLGACEQSSKEEGIFDKNIRRFGSPNRIYIRE